MKAEFRWPDNSLMTVETVREWLKHPERANLPQHFAQSHSSYLAFVGETVIPFLLAQYDAVADTSVCTKCGWIGVPPNFVDAMTRHRDFKCGNPTCSYYVWPPKSARIAELESKLVTAEQRCCVAEGDVTWRWQGTEIDGQCAKHGSEK